MERECPYNKCDGSGFLPFIKNGKRIANVTLFCECHPIYGEDAYESIPLVTEGKRSGVVGKIQRGRLHLYQDDFDFPMSYDFYRSLCQLHGWDDPGEDTLPEPEIVKEKIREPWSREQWQYVQQTRAMTLHLQKKVAELYKKEKPDKYTIESVGNVGNVGEK